jgi:hypothetical protein
MAHHLVFNNFAETGSFPDGFGAESTMFIIIFENTSTHYIFLESVPSEHQEPSPKMIDTKDKRAAFATLDTYTDICLLSVHCAI